MIASLKTEKTERIWQHSRTPVQKVPGSITSTTLAVIVRHQVVLILGEHLKVRVLRHLLTAFVIYSYIRYCVLQQLEQRRQIIEEPIS